MRQGKLHPEQNTEGTAWVCEGLLSTVRQKLGADAVAVVATSDGAPRAVLSTDSQLCIRAGCESDEATPVFAGYDGSLSVPVSGSCGAAMILVGLWRRAGAATAAHRDILCGIAPVLAAALDAGTCRDADPGAMAVFHGASDYLRLTESQAAASEILQYLLRAPTGVTNDAINRALAGIGKHCVADRVYVFRIRDDAFLDNTHEWCGSGIEPMIDELQGVPIEVAPHWIAAFRRDEPVYIPDVMSMPDDSPEKEILMMQGIKSLLAVPLIEAGELTGFVGIDCVRRHHEFLPGEISLLSSVANAIGAVFRTGAASAQMQRAQRRLQEERNRLKATLDAVPDLIFEVDSTGRYRTIHSDNHKLLLLPWDELVGKTPEEVLPPDLAMAIRRLLDEAVAGGIANAPEIPVKTPCGPSFRNVTVSRRAPVSNEDAPSFVIVARDVTADVVAREKLKRLGRIAETMTNLVVLTDVDGRTTWVNSAFEAKTGYTLSDMLHRTPGSVLQREDCDPIAIDRIKRALARHEPVSAELLNYTKAGAPYWIEINIKPLFDAQGRPEGFMSVQTDITERKHYEERLAESARRAMQARQRISAAVEALPDAFAFYDEEDRLVLCNERYRQYYPKTAPVILPGNTFEEILRYGLERGEYEHAIGREEEWLAERMRLHALDEHDGEQLLSDGRWLRVVERRLPDGGHVGLRVDITELKRLAEEANAERLAALEASQDGISVTNESGHFIYMNRAHRDMFKIAPDQDVRPLHWTDLLSERMPADATMAAHNALHATGNWRGEVLARRMDGADFLQEISLSRRSDGGTFAICRDITEVRQAMHEQQRLREELQLAQRREVIGQLAAGVAHDFNNLLAAISGSASLLATGADPETNISRIRAAADEAAALVNRLFDLWQRKSNILWFDLRNQVQAATDLARSGDWAGIALRLRLPPEPVMVEGDPTDIMQVVLNLVLNARDAVLAKSERVDGDHVTITLDTDNSPETDTPTIGVIDPSKRYACLSVEDSGIGLDQDTMDRIFELNFTTKGDLGTGLGLPIVAGVVSSNGGAIDVHSAPGAGASFCVAWPLDRFDPAKEVPVLAMEAATGRLDGRAVLVVDDNIEVLRILTAFLEQAGAEVAACSDPEDVIEAVRDAPDAWDVVVTDFSMPEITGSDLARRLHAIRPDLPVILVTAMPDWRARSGRNETIEFAATLSKPVSRAELVNCAEAAAGNVRTMKERA